MKMPSKNVIFVLVACIISISLVFFAKQSNPEVKQINLNVESATSSEDTRALDEYLTALPSATSTFKISTSTKLTPEPKTLTNTFVKDFFGKYLSIQSGGSVDEASKSSLIDSIIDRYSGSTATTHFSQSNINIVSSLDKEKIRKYANSFAEIEENGTRSAQNYSKDGEKSLKNITLAGFTYKKLANDLASLEVPGGLSQVHLAIINNYYRLGDALEQVENSTEDPIKIIFLLKEIKESQPERDLLYTAMTNFIKNSGIIFSDDEPGHYFTLMANQ